MSNGKLSARRVVVASTAVMVAICISACGSDSSSSSSSSSESSGTASATEEHKLAFFGASAENIYTQYMYKAAVKKAEELGSSLEFFDGKFDGAAQIAQMQDAITSGRFDGFVAMPNDGAGIVPVAEQAIGDGIKVAAVQFPIGPDSTDAQPQIEGLTTSVIEDVVQGAEVTAESINAVCKGIDPCKVGVLWGGRAIPFEAAKQKPFKEALDPTVEVVAEADAEFLEGPGEKEAAAMLQANPDINVIASPSGDEMILGAERAIEAAGGEIGTLDRPDGAIALVGYGAATAGVEHVRSGRWYSTYALLPATMGEKVVELLIAELNGEELPADERGVVQNEISPIGSNVTSQVLKEFPDFKGEWES